jgi:glycosyltransferase involved in cell wall biosynthesis
MQNPKVSVLMSVYNGESHLGEAVESILNQTFTDFEFIIVDDRSTDSTWSILSEYAARDKRIVLQQNKNNIGLAKSLNKGLAIARGEYIARQDADDISLSVRFANQVEYLDKNIEIGVLGTEVELIDDRGRPILDFSPPFLPTTPGMVRWALFFRCCLHHPTVMVRRRVYNNFGGYDPGCPHAEDYELWLRLAVAKIKICNVQQKLVRLRKHSGSVTNVHEKVHRRNADNAVRGALAAHLGKDVSLELVRMMRNQSLINSADDALSTAELINELYDFIVKLQDVSLFEMQQIRKDVTRILLNIGIVSARKRPAIFVQMLKRSFFYEAKHTMRLLLGKTINEARNFIYRQKSMTISG